MHRPRLGALAGGTRRRRVGAGLALLAVIAVVVIVILDNSASSSPNAAADASQVGGAATVERRNLTETDTEAGTLSYNNPQTVYNRLGGTITWLPNVGQEIKPGGTLYKVDGQPVILMDGAHARLPDPRAGDQRRQRRAGAQPQSRASGLQLRRDRGQRRLAAGDHRWRRAVSGVARRDPDRARCRSGRSCFCPARN